MKTNQILFRKDSGSMTFSNEVITLQFDAMNGFLTGISLGDTPFVASCDRQSDVSLTVDGHYSAADPVPGCELLHPTDATKIVPTALKAVRLEREVNGKTLVLTSETALGLLEKRYTLYTEGELQQVTRHFMLIANRDVRVDEVDLPMPKLLFDTLEDVGTNDAYLVHGQGGCLMVMAGAMRTECSFVKPEEGLLVHRVYLCTEVKAGESISFGEDYVMLADGEHWRDAVDNAARQHTRDGLICLNPIPEQYGRMAIFEVMVGSWKMPSREKPNYEHVSDLIADLDRIRSLGFNVIQLMPTFPFPSYTCEDLTDLCLQNSAGEDIRPLVEAIHARGMRLIMDIVTHGVRDIESCEKALDPFDKKPEELFLKRHPLRREHPDWFLHGDDGLEMRSYTWTFDHANEEWQEYVVEALAGYVRDFDVDGFRFDALEWALTPDCSPAVSHTGGAHLRWANYQLYRKLRDRIDPIKGDVLWMDENPHVYLTDVMYACYAWDTPGKLERVRKGLLTAADVQRYQGLRQQYYPKSFNIVQYGENHDVAQNKGWIYIVDAHGYHFARLMIAFGALSGGPCMCFMGGEIGNEDLFKGLIGLRERFPELFANNGPDFDHAVSPDPMVACICRHHKDTCMVAVFNMAKEDKAITVNLFGKPMEGEWTDALTGETVDAASLAIEGEWFRILVRK